MANTSRTHNYIVSKTTCIRLYVDDDDLETDKDKQRLDAADPETDADDPEIDADELDTLVFSSDVTVDASITFDVYTNPPIKADIWRKGHGWNDSADAQGPHHGPRCVSGQARARGGGG